MRPGGRPSTIGFTLEDFQAYKEMRKLDRERAVTLASTHWDHVSDHFFFDLSNNPFRWMLKFREVC